MYFQIERDKDGFFFAIVGKNNKSVLKSKPYKRKANAVKSIQEIWKGLRQETSLPILDRA